MTRSPSKMKVCLGSLVIAQLEESFDEANSLQKASLVCEQGITFPEILRSAIMGIKKKDGTAMFEKGDAILPEMLSTGTKEFSSSFLAKIIVALEEAGITVEILEAVF